MNYSYWEQETFTKSIDVAIIGSGIVGLSAAIYLKQANPGLNVTVIEKGVKLAGASLRNAGFACFGSPTELLDDLKTRTRDEVFRLVERRYRGLSSLRQLLGDDVIEYEPLGGYEVFDNETSFKDSRDAIEGFNKELLYITGEKRNYRIADDKIDEFGFKGVKHIIENVGEGQLNTGKMMEAFINKAIKWGVNIINGVEVTAFKPNGDEVVLTGSWQPIRAKRVLFATNAYTGSLVKNVDIKPGRAQVLITEPIPGLKIKGSFHYEKGYYYFRNVGQRLLFGGGRNLDFEGETTTEIGLTEKIQARLEQLLRDMILPGVKFTIESRWSGIMGLGRDTKAPMVTEVERHVFMAVRLGGMGVALGTLVGKEVSEMIIKSYKD
jgi:glycine/D-amino acid oxidase-like deaminating enzyme